MAFITRQELQSGGKWWTWINYEGFNTFIAETDYQLTEEEAIVLKDNYNNNHLYDSTPQVIINLYEHRNVIENAVTFIKTTDPTLNQWNNYLTDLPWDDVLVIRWFLAMLAKGLAERAEVDLTQFTETEVLAKLKTWIINTPARRLRKILFGDL